MNRRTQLNLVLAASAIVLSVLLWLDQPEPAKPTPPLLDIARQDIDRIEIHPGGGLATIVLKHTGDAWRMTQPVDARARGNRVESLLAMAATTPVRRYPADEFNAKQTGLTRTRATIRFGQAPILKVGARTPIDGHKDTRYVRVAKTIALAPLPNARLLDMNWPQWIDPHLLRPNAQLKALHLPGLTLTRADTGGWRVTPKSRDRGADAAQFTVDAWRQARALTITKAGNQPAMANVKLIHADGSTRRLEVIARQPQLLLRDPALGVTFHLPANRASALLDMRHPATAPNQSDGRQVNRRRQPRDHNRPQGTR